VCTLFKKFPFRLSKVHTTNLERPSVAMYRKPPCLRAFNYLDNKGTEPLSKMLPRECPHFYVPKHVVQALFNDEVGGLNLKNFFLGKCEDCEQDGDSIEKRDIRFYKRELCGRYFTIYATPIYSRRPGLINLIQQNEKRLQGTTYLQDGDFTFLKGPNVNVAEPDEVKNACASASVRIPRPNARASQRNHCHPMRGAIAYS
jgi:hypothetical protein